MGVVELELAATQVGEGINPIVTFLLPAGEVDEPDGEEHPTSTREGAATLAPPIAIFIISASPLTVIIGTSELRRLALRCGPKHTGTNACLQAPLHTCMSVL